jgi:hypothetical protein
MSISPRQNFLNPPPVPEMPTVTLTAPFLDFWKSSATASVTGYTVEEPSTLTIDCAIAADMPSETAKARETDDSFARNFIFFLQVEGVVIESCIVRRLCYGSVTNMTLE